MEKSSEKRGKRKRSFASKQNIVAVLVVLLIFIYVLVQCYSVLNVKFKTQTAALTAVYDTIDVKALAVRDEQEILSGGGLVTVPLLKDGEKVQRGGQIAMQFQNADSAERYSQYLELTDTLKYYGDMESQAVGQATDVESLDKAILSDVNNYIRSVSSENSGKITDYQDSLNDKFTRRQLLIGENIDFSSVVSSINAEIDALDIKNANPAGYINAENSGIFSGYTDGLESTFDYSKIEQLDVETLNSYIEAANAPRQSEAIGKVIKSFDWYFCAVVDTADLTGLKNGKTLEITLKDSSEVIKCKIVKGAEDTPLGTEKTVLVLKCNEINSNISSFRLEDIQIRLNKYEGIKVPLEAVHVEENQKGVYALVSSVVKWRPAEVLYTGDDFALLSYNKDTEDGIKLYDQIIIQGKELHDGKVYA